MPVLRNHAVAYDLRALRQVLRQRDHDGLVDGADRDLARLAVGVDQADDGGRHGLVETQRHRLRRLRQQAAIGRLGRDQRGVRKRRRRKTQRHKPRRQSREQAPHRRASKVLASA